MVGGIQPLLRSRSTRAPPTSRATSSSVSPGPHRDRDATECGPVTSNPVNRKPRSTSHRPPLAAPPVTSERHAPRCGGQRPTRGSIRSWSLPYCVVANGAYPTGSRPHSAAVEVACLRARAAARQIY